MQRREALQLVAVLVGGTIIGADAFLTGCKTTPVQTGLFSDEDVALMDEIGETILPHTADSPGAKEAGIGPFMKVIVTDCYAPDEQATFTKGLATIKAKKFMDMSPTDRHNFLTDLDKQSKALTGDDDAKKKSPLGYYIMLKQLTLWGYFTSKPGATIALRYIETPGRYDGDVPYKKGEKAWAL